ncbi:MAG TPA: BatD family protein [Chitinophagaceae bacterium]|nr:BatD family protein [Chitinophagaceae bacterium]
MVKSLQKIFTKPLFLFFAIVGWYHVYAQANFVAVCPQKKIGKNDYLQIEFRMENASAVESINPPAFKNFSVVSGPNEATSSSDINGKIDQSVSVSFVLKPNGPGNYTIPPATAKADGKEFHTDPVSIQVTNSSAVSSASNGLASSLAPLANFNFDFPDEPAGDDYDDYVLKKGENIHDKIKKDLFIKADVTKTSCYVNEPIVVTFKLYTRLRLQTTVTDEPSFNGFSVSEMDLNNHNSSFREKYNGRDYNVYVLRKVQLFPSQAGTITIDPLVTDDDVTFIKQDYAGSQSGDSFMDMMQNFANAMPQQGSLVQQHVTIKSEPVMITVKPLPDTGRPADFKGAVGSFTFQSSIQKNSFTTDDANSLKVSIAGAGNIQMVNPPKLSWPQGIDGYDAQISDTTDKNSVPLKGIKTFTYPFTVSVPGTYTIPGVSFSFFNPQTGTYKDLTSGPFTITVIQGKGIHSSPLLNVVAKDSTGIWDVLRDHAMYLIAGLVLLAGILFGIFKKARPVKKPATNGEAQTKDDNIPEKQQPEREVPANPLEEAHQKLSEGNSSAFYRTMDVSIRKYLSEKFKVPANELTRKRINDELDKCNVGLGTSLRLLSLMEKIELNLYAPPGSANEMADVYEKASEVISLLDKQC